MCFLCDIFYKVTDCFLIKNDMFVLFQQGLKLHGILPIRTVHQPGMMPVNTQDNDLRGSSLGWISILKPTIICINRPGRCVFVMLDMLGQGLCAIVLRPPTQIFLKRIRSFSHIMQQADQLRHGGHAHRFSKLPAQTADMFQMFFQTLCSS